MTDTTPPPPLALTTDRIISSFNAAVAAIAVDQNEQDERIDAARVIDIALSYPGPVPVGLIAIPIVRAAVSGLTGVASGTGTGEVAIQRDNGEIVAVVSFPSGDVDVAMTTLPPGRIRYTATGALSDISITLGGLR